MRDDIETVLRSGSAQFADTVRVPAAELVRARGERRRRRQVLGSAALAVLAVAGGLAGYLALAGSPGPGEPATGNGHALRLVAPRRYAMGVPNPLSFVIPGSGVATTVTVSVDLGRPGYAVYREPVLLRRDPLAGRWAVVRVALRHGDWQGSYSLRVPAGPTMQRLLLVPAAPVAAPPTGAGRVRIRVAAGRTLLGAQEGPPAHLAFTTDTWTPQDLTSVPRGASRQLAYRLTNHLGVGYRVRISLYSPLCGSGRSCPPPGDEVQWLDSGAWRTLGRIAYGPGYGEFLRTAWLAPHGTITVRVRLIAGASPQSAVGMLDMIVSPDRSSFPGLSRWYPYSSSGRHTGIITVG